MLSPWQRRSNSFKSALESLAFPTGWALLLVSSLSLRTCMFSDSASMPLSSPPPASPALHSRPSPTSKFSRAAMTPSRRYWPIFHLYLCSLISRWPLAYVVTISCASWRNVPDSTSSFSCTERACRMN
ncbi:hypothetical protein C8R46DRAFT_1295733 [Mycena filopes]|nr:hypothetical protein C8R46DRAFT_1295733 [Mycena filopes]